MIKIFCDLCYYEVEHVDKKEECSFYFFGERYIHVCEQCRVSISKSIMRLIEKRQDLQRAQAVVLDTSGIAKIHKSRGLNG